MDPLRLYEGLQKGSEHGLSEFGVIKALIPEGTREKVKSNSQVANSLNKIRESASEFASEPLSQLSFSLFKLFAKVGDRKKYENEYFKRRRRLLSVSMSVWLWETEEDIHLLEDCIWAICDEYTWSLPAHIHDSSMELYCSQMSIPDHFREEPREPFEGALNLDLFACETGFALAECCALLEDKLEPLVVARAKKEISRRIVDSYVKQNSLQQWETMENNWCAVCACSVAGAAIYVTPHDTTLTSILMRLHPAMQRFLKSFGYDGACSEGLAYWTYGVSFYVAYADLLRRRTKGVINLFDEDFRIIAEFQQKCYFAGGATITFSDAERRDSYRPGLTDFLKREYDTVIVPAEGDVQYATSSHCGNYAPALRDLLWTDSEPPKKMILQNTVFPSVEWMICHHKTRGLAAKGGHNDEQHNHNDVGNFVLYKDGAMTLCDLGKGRYNRQYFGPKRYDIFCNSSLSHNVPIINSKQQTVGRDHTAKDVKIDQQRGSMQLDMTAAYDEPALKRLIRKMDFADDKFTLKDTFEFDGADISIIERFVTLVEPVVKDGVVTVSGDKLVVTGCSSQPAISTEKFENHHGKWETAYKIDYNVDSNEFGIAIEWM
ncbi:hypothetical protein VKS41_006621 [Umbelopsis sp. WA50703]